MPNTLFADILLQDLDLRVKVTGNSMRPFINNGEVVTLRKVPTESLRRGDIVYYTCMNGFPVMHRIDIISILPNNSKLFTTKGDALMLQDDPVSADQILGKIFYVEKNLPVLGPLSFSLDSILSSGLYKVYELFFSLKCKTRNYLKLALKPQANK